MIIFIFLKMMSYKNTIKFGNYDYDIEVTLLFLLASVLNILKFVLETNKAKIC